MPFAFFPSLVSKYGVDKFPSIVVVKNDEGQTVVKYDGELAFQPLSKFFDQHALPAKASSSSSSDKKKTNGKTEVLHYKYPPPVTTLCCVPSPSFPLSAELANELLESASSAKGT